MTDRETRLREIRERVEKAKEGVGIPYSCEWDQVLIEEDVPWLLAEVEQLQRELRIEQRRADELEGIGRETRKILDRHQELASIDRDERTPEQTEDLISLSRELRGHNEEDQLRAEVLRLREELDGVKCELELRKTNKHKRRTSELLRISKQLDTGTAAFDYPGSAVDG